MERLNKIFEAIRKIFLKKIDLRTSCYIAGGCIASLVQEEEPNDIDLIFNDLER